MSFATRGTSTHFTPCCSFWNNHGAYWSLQNSETPRNANLPDCHLSRMGKLPKMDTYLVAQNPETPRNGPSSRGGKYSEIPNFAHPCAGITGWGIWVISPFSPPRTHGAKTLRRILLEVRRHPRTGLTNGEFPHYAPGITIIPRKSVESRPCT